MPGDDDRIRFPETPGTAGRHQRPRLTDRAKLTRRMVLLAALLAGGIVGLILGLVIDSQNTPQQKVVLNVRQGTVSVPPGENAVLTLGPGLVDMLIRTAVEGTNLPVQVMNVTSQFESDGIKVSGNARESFLGLPITLSWDAIAVPTVDNRGQLHIQLVNVHAAGGHLPDLFTGVIETAIDSRLNKAVGASLSDYRVSDVELNPGGLLVYLMFAGEPTPTNTH